MTKAGADPTVEGSVVSLPKGGGAVGGPGEKFSPDLFTGTGSFSLPIAVPPGRHGLEPQLVLSYSSGHRNGPFGLGWQLSLPGVARKTSAGVPRYLDAPAADGTDRADTGNYWEVHTRDGLRTRYGTPRPPDAGPVTTVGGIVGTRRAGGALWLAFLGGDPPGTWELQLMTPPGCARSSRTARSGTSCWP